MKKLTVLAHMCLSFSLLQIINAQEDQESTFDKIWDNVVLYENDENSLMSKFLLTGRLQGEYHSLRMKWHLPLIMMIMIGEDSALVSKLLFW